MALSSDTVLANRRILAIDDDPVILSMIKFVLQSAGAECETAENGREGLDRIFAFDPQMILLDYMMPYMNGLQVYETIQTDPAYANFRSTPILMLTAKTDNSDEQQALFRKGLDAYLHKPFGFRELINVIANVFALRDARSENTHLQNEIHQVRNYLQSVFDHITDIVSVQDVGFRIQSHNRSASRINEGKNLEGHLCHQVYFRRTEVCPGCPVPGMLENGQPATTEFRLSEDDRSFETSVYPIRSPSGDVTTFVEIIKETTERRRLEQRLIDSSKLASLGTLAAGVAHEINNPLCIILGFAQSMGQDRSLPESAHRELTIIEQEAARCGKILQDLLSYAKPSSSEKTLVNLTDVLAACIELLHQMLKRQAIDVKTDWAQTLPFVQVDVSKIQQVFINILLNSVQAMPDGGTLRVGMHLDGRCDRIEVVIEDTGRGIPFADLERVFDPFFTTKIGSGTGLGLSICRAIVHEHLGTITVTSTEEKGTCVTVALPIDPEIS